MPVSCGAAGGAAQGAALARGAAVGQAPVARGGDRHAEAELVGRDGAVDDLVEGGDVMADL